MRAAFVRLRQALSASPRECLAAALAAAGLLWVYGPALAGLAQRWGSDSRYSHGYLVPLFSLYLLWPRRGRLAPGTWRPSWWGVPLVLAGLALEAAGTFLFFESLSAVSLLASLAGLAVLLGGWAALRWSWPAIAFLVFMMPLPFGLEVALAHPLQRLGTRVSTHALQTLGFAAFAEGNVIRMGEVRIGVVQACSGLSMLLLFFALSTAVVLLARRPLWERLLLVASAVPIAVLSNVTRITVTGVLHKFAGPELADYVFHDLAGWLMMPLALGLLWVEMRLVAWVLPTREVGDVPALGLPLFGPPPPAPTAPSRPAPAAGAARRTVSDSELRPAAK
jgi:exosortase